MKNVASNGQTELFSVESLELELGEIAGPTAEDMADMAVVERELTAEESGDVMHGYGYSEWLDVMAEQRAIKDRVSRTVASARVLEDRRNIKQAAKREVAARQAERRAVIGAGMAVIADLQESALYALMGRLTVATRTRGAVFSMTEDSRITVSRVVWVKGTGNTVEEYGTIVRTGKRYALTVGELTVKMTESELMESLNGDMPERSDTLMPRKFRDVLRTHRHKNSAPSDVTGERATRGAGHLEDADMVTYPKLTQVVTTAGRPSRQGVRGGSAMTDAERRESDRARQAAYRAAKKAEKLAQAAS